MEALILLFLLMGWGGRGGGGGGERETVPPAPGPRALPASTTETTPWPQVVPSGLPAFPAGWEYDNPPPAEVRARAKALLDSLWRTGQGSKVTEQTAGRWITYRAEITKGNKHGVVAYRLKKVAGVPAPARPAPRAPGAPQTARNQPASYPIDSRSPGIPQASPAPGSVRVPAPGGNIDVRVGPADTRPILHQGAGKGALLSLKPYVLVVQNKLLVDLSHGGAGEFGPLTFAAVKRFQGDQVAQGQPGWTTADIDGVVGPHTWAALDRISAAAA